MGTTSVAIVGEVLIAPVINTHANLWTLAKLVLALARLVPLLQATVCP